MTQYLYTVTEFIPNTSWLSDDWQEQIWKIEKWEITYATTGSYHVIAPWNAKYIYPRSINGKAAAGNKMRNLYAIPEDAIAACQKMLLETIEQAQKEVELAKAGLDKMPELYNCLEKK